MSDLGRKGLGRQVQEKVNPDTQKSYAEKAGENFTGTYDKIASTVQEEGEKSTTQKLIDSTRSGAYSVQNDGKGIIDSAQDTAGNIVGAAADKVKAAADYVTGASNDVSDDTKSS